MQSARHIDRVRSAVSPVAGVRRWGMAIEAACREGIALLRQTPLMPFDLRWRAIEVAPTVRDIVVVLHGLFATAGAMRPLRRAIESGLGVPTASFTYEPGCDVRTLCARLSALLGGIPRTTRVHLVGHSLGGIVARYHVQVSPCDSRVVQTISLGSPFAGSRVASSVPRWIARDVAVGSGVLAAIERNWRRGDHVPHTSIVASHDQMVIPRFSAAYPHGDVVIAEARGHNALLFDREVAERVVDILRRGLTRHAFHGTGGVSVLAGILSMRRDPGSLPLAAG